MSGALANPGAEGVIMMEPHEPTAATLDRMFSTIETSMLRRERRGRKAKIFSIGGGVLLVFGTSLGIGAAMQTPSALAEYGAACWSDWSTSGPRSDVVLDVPLSKDPEERASQALSLCGTTSTTSVVCEGHDGQANVFPRRDATTAAQVCGRSSMAPLE